MEENTKIRKEDNLWKVIMEELFSDFIRFLHPGIEQVLDLNRGYQFLDKELDQVLQSGEHPNAPKLVDKLVRVYSHEGKEEFVLLHFEFQAQYRANFGKRMFTYFSRLMDKYDKPITAYAIFTEATQKKRPDKFSVSFLGTELSYKFNTYKISGPTDEELLADRNPFAMVVLAARGAFGNKSMSDARERDQALSKFKFDLIRRLITLEMDRHRKKHILSFIINYIHFEFKETLITFEKELYSLIRETDMTMEEQVFENKINRWKEEWRQEAIHEGHLQGILEGKLQGILEGKLEGIREGKREGKMEQAQLSVSNLIKNSNFSDRDIAKLNGVPLAFVKSIRAGFESPGL